MIVPVEGKQAKDISLDNDEITINIPFPKDKPDKSKSANLCGDIVYFLYYITRYVSLFFVLSFIGKTGAKFIYWANETNHWKYPDGWDWEDINYKIFIQAFIGLLICLIFIGCCAK